MLGAKKATHSTALALLRVKPLAGYIGLEKHKTVRPAIDEMNVRARSHQETSCCHDAKENGMRRRFLFYICERSCCHTLCRWMRF